MPPIASFDAMGDTCAEGEEHLSTSTTFAFFVSTPHTKVFSSNIDSVVWHI